MKPANLFRSILAITGFVAAIASAQEPPKAAPGVAPKPALPPGPPVINPEAKKVTPDAFRAKLTKDEAPLPAGGQLVMSYANVVEKIMPSVVTITSSGKMTQRQMLGQGQMPDMDQIPPEMREFFRRFFGAPGMGDEDGGRNPFDPNDRAPRRNAPKQQPKQDEKDHRLGLGSGMIISSDGYILTNNHVVEEATKIEVAVDMPGGIVKKHTAKLVGRDPLTDVAIIKIEGTEFPAATLGDSSKLRVGDIVLAAGAPMELAQSVSQGIVSALGRADLGIVREGRMAGFENFIQTDAAINPGNSGGPLVDAMGRVVGINTAIFTRTGMNQGIGFAIPINMALGIAMDLIDDGKVQRGFLGIGMADIDADTAKLYGLPEQSGSLVTRVVGGSPAEKAGVEVDDIITSVGGNKVTDSSSLRLIVSGNKPGSTIPIEVLRKKQKLTLNATLDTMDEQALAQGVPGTSPRKAPVSETIELISGVTVQNITTQLAEKYELGKDLTGVVVTKVEASSSAAAVGLQEGDVIQSINGTPVKLIDEAKAETTKDKSKAIKLKVYRKGDTMLVVVRE